MTELEQQLQQSLALMRQHQAPMPLTRRQAEEQAVRLRQRMWTYLQIAQVMGVYHGDYRSAAAWNAICRNRGMPPKHYSTGARRVPPQLRGRIV